MLNLNDLCETLNEKFPGKHDWFWSDEQEMTKFVLTTEPNTDNSVVNNLILFARHLLQEIETKDKEISDLSTEITHLENYMENQGLEE